MAQLTKTSSSMQHQKTPMPRRPVLLVCALALVAAPWLFKVTLEYAAQRKADDVAEQLVDAHPSSPAFLTDATRLIHKAYTEGNVEVSQSLLMRMRPYLTNRLLPAWYRVQDGAIDILHIEGECDSAARTLAFLLSAQGLEADQFNTVTPTNAHSVVVVAGPANPSRLLDPMFGVIPFSNEQMLSPDDAREQARRGVPLDELWRPVAETARREFYEDFAAAVFAKRGDELIIEAKVRLDGQSKTLGKLDQSWIDVAGAGAKAQPTPYWHYMGSRYDRGWVRRLSFAQDTRVIIDLVEPVNRKFITSNLLPEVAEKQLIYQVKAGQELVFVDDHAGRDWLKLRSYQDVDSIRFEPL